MRRTIAAVGAASAATLVIAGFFVGGARAAAPNPAAATAALRYLYGAQKADGSVDGSAGETEDAIIGAADNGYDPATLKTSGGVTAYSYLQGLITGGKVTTAGGAAKLVLAWVAAGKPAAIDGAALVTKLNTPAGSGGFLQPNGSWLTSKTFGNGFTQALGILADVAAGAALPPHATGWLLCAQQADGGFIDQIDPSGSAPPASGTCGAQSSDTNDTGMALQALHAAGLSSASALSYLHKAQQADGGFGYDGAGPSDPDSDAVVIEGLAAARQDPAGSSWTKSSKNALTSLATFETPAASGKYAFAAGGTPDTFTTSSIPAALALDPYGKSVTFTPGLSPFASPATPAPSATATATPRSTSPAAPSGVIAAPRTGGGPLEPGDAGIAIAVVGAGSLGIGASAAWRRRQRRRR